MTWQKVFPISPSNGASLDETSIATMTSIIAASIDVNRLTALARKSSLAGELQRCGIPPLGKRVAIACDEAFRFVYPTLVDGWRREGAEVVRFSPLANEAPDPVADSIYLPGGYPELWAGQLANAENFTAGLRLAASEGKPVYGECGGYMVLGKDLVDAQGRGHSMAGLLPLSTSFCERRLQLGYLSATLIGSGVLGRAGARFRGHEFHYATIVAERGAAEPLFSVTDAAGRHRDTCGLRRGSVFGSFIHLIDSCGTT